MTFPGNTDDAEAQAVKDEGMSAEQYGEVAPATEVEADNGMSEKTAIILMSVLIVLAVGASIVMLFASSTGWMKIAVLAALWAAVIGALLVTRYRRQLDSERERFIDLERLHQIELDRELATHREQELILEQNYLDSLEGNTEDTISQLRAEIVALREQLSELLGEGFDDERVALIARAERLRELDSPHTASPMKDPVANNRPEPRAKTFRDEATANGTVGAHTSQRVSETAQAQAAAQAAQEPVDVPEVPKTESTESHSAQAGGGFNTGSFRAVNWEESSSAAGVEETTQMDTIFTEPETAAQPEEPEPSEAEESAETSATSRHGRRRREDHSDGLTVADLLKQMRK